MKSIKVYSNEQKCSLAEWQAAQTSFRAFMDSLDVDLMICNGRTGFNHLPVANQFCPLLFVCSYQFVFSKFTNKSLFEFTKETKSNFNNNIFNNKFFCNIFYFNHSYQLMSKLWYRGIVWRIIVMRWQSITAKFWNRF